MPLLGRHAAPYTEVFFLVKRGIQTFQPDRATGADGFAKGPEGLRTVGFAIGVEESIILGAAGSPMPPIKEHFPSRFRTHSQPRRLDASRLRSCSDKPPQMPIFPSLASASARQSSRIVQ